MRGLLGLAAALVALVAVPAAHEAVPSGTKIVYESYSDGDFELYAVDPETHAVVQLTDNFFDDSSPTPSPDGTKVAFYSRAGTSVVNTDGTGRRPLRRCSGYNLSWSPDSSRIVCESGANQGIVLVGADGRGAQTITGARGYAPSWSPDGTTIAYVGPQGIYTVSPDGSNPRHLTSHAADELTLPVWSPDSHSILFVSDEPKTRSDLYVVAADGSALRRLATNISTDRPAWSPDGTLIAFGAPSAVKNAAAIYTIAPDGSGKALAAAGTHGESVVEPTWSPNGSALAYVRGRFVGGTVDGDIFSVTREGIRGPVTTPFPSGATVSSPAWTGGALQDGTLPRALDWLSLPTKLQVGGTNVLAALFASGRTAVAARATSCALVVVWKPGKKSRRLNPCANVDTLNWLAAGAGGVAWLTAAHSHSEYQQYLTVVGANGKRLTIASAEADPETGAGEYIGDLYGEGPLLVFNFWHASAIGDVSRASSWRIVPRGTKGAVKCPASHGDVAPGISARRCVRLKRGNAMAIVSASADRIVGAPSPRTVRVLGPDGRALETRRFPTNVAGAQAQGSNLVVLMSGQLFVYTLGGKQKATWPLPSGVTLPLPYLLDVYGNYALVNAGAVYLVRLSDGKTVPLQVEGQAPPVDAQIDRDGLFYLYNRPYTKQPGRILFVPMAALDGLLSERADSHLEQVAVQTPRLGDE